MAGPPTERRQQRPAAGPLPVASGVPTGRPPSSTVLPHGQRPLFSRRLLQRQTIVMCDPRLHPITACRWRLHSCTRGSPDWPVGRIACTPLVEASKATVAWLAACPHGLCPRTGRIIDYFYLWGPPPPTITIRFLALCYFSPFPSGCCCSFFFWI